MLFSAIIASAALILSVGIKEWSVETDRIDIRQGGMTAMETLVRYIGLAGNNHLTGGITAASSTSVTFLADVNNAGTNQTVTISYAANKITATIVGASTTTLVIVSNVSSFSFTYYDNTGAVAQTDTQAHRDLIRIVTMAMTMTKGSDSISFSSSAFCRNQ
jgi:hypothetical protein